jgi:hypothetical protein
MNKKVRPATTTIHKAAAVLGIGRNQAFAAADRGDIKTVPGMGRRRPVPIAFLAEVTGLSIAEVESRLEEAD